MLHYSESKLKADPGINFGRPYQQCAKTVMDTISDPLITFDEHGVSNYFHEYNEQVKESQSSDVSGSDRLNSTIELIKRHGKGKRYDCIAGVSGGVDSTYLMLLAKRFGLRPLVVHFDNGWNSELAVKNIESLLSELDFELYTLVVDWLEFRDLQLSYFKANVVDIEALTDHAIIGTLYKLAHKHSIKYILSGANMATEAILPRYWIFNKTDSLNIKAIHKKFGQVDLKTYPFFSTKVKRYYLDVKKITTVEILDQMTYNKQEAKLTIEKELGWRDYGSKHGESIFTRFYQGYILPVKFGIDKRKAHYSSLICSDQMTRQEAIDSLKKPIYTMDQLLADREFVLKKLGMTSEQFDKYLLAPRVEHTVFKHERGVWDDIPFIKPFRPVWKLVKAIRKGN